MKKIIFTLVAASNFMLFEAIAIGAEYTVDPNGSISVAVANLQAGDTLLVRGGVYRESISVSRSGSPDNRITIKNYPDERPVIDGSDVMGGWRRCESQETCGGNPNWQNIYYTHAPAEAKLFSANLYQDDEMLSVSQYPNPSDPFYMDNKDDYLAVPPSVVTSTSIIDARLEDFGGEKLVGASVGIWVQPNVVVFKRITDYIAGENKIIFDVVGGPGPYTDRDTRYSILNSLDEGVLDMPGEYIFNETPEADGTHKIYLWPLNDQDLATDGEVTVSTRGRLVVFGSHDYITVEGLKLQKGINGIVWTGWGGTNTGNILRNMEITRCRSAGTSNMVYMYGSDNLIVENNYLHNNAGRSRGILIGSSNNIVRNNIIEKQGGTCIYFGGVNKGQITGNIIIGGKGSHSNGITTYQGCLDILVAGNKVIDSNIAFTMQASSNITLYGNLFDGADNVGYIVANWGSMTGTIAILNNTVIGSNNNVSIHSGSADKIITMNNILDGGGGGERSHNIYTSLAWSQRAFYDWYLQEGEVVEENLDNIFVNTAGQDYRLKEGSPAIDAGTDITEFLPIEMFPDFDFNVDINGNPRLQENGYDIGAYEYYTGQVTYVPEDDDNNEVNIQPEADPLVITETLLKVFNNIIKGYGGSAVIRCDLKEAGNLSVRVYDAKGKEVNVLFNGALQSGRHEFQWAANKASGGQVGSGIYFVRMKSGSYGETKKIAVIK